MMNEKRHRRFYWSWSGFTVALVAAGLTFGWAASVYLIASHAGEYPLPDGVIQAQLALGQTLAGGVVGFVAAKISSDSSKETKNVDTEISTYEQPKEGATDGNETIEIHQSSSDNSGGPRKSTYIRRGGSGGEANT